MTNPTVHIALNQIRLVVNELIGRYGRPHSIAIELGRDLPAGAIKRRERERVQKENQDRNQRFNEKLQQLGQQLNADNRLRLFLWEELSEDPNGRCCPFSGDKIGIADLFSGNTEVEHLIPFSQSLDDSRANKVICTRKANRDKGNRTPYEAFGNSPYGYDWGKIAARVEQLPDYKQWRFQKDAIKVWQQSEDADFTSRHLNDTRYIGRLAREYLESICRIDKIDVLTGRLTSLLRWHWGLNSALRDGGKGTGRKNRDDHRHHAVDAIVIGMTSRSMLQKVATEARKLEEIEQVGSQPMDRLFSCVNGGKSAIDPWDGFRADVVDTVRNIVVSHKVRRKTLRPGITTDGQLHNDTAYGLVEKAEKRNLYEVVTRKPISFFTKRKNIERIRDARLREEFRLAFEAAEAGEEAKAIQDLARRKGIRSLRQTETLSVIPILDAEGNAYKAYKGDSNWGIEIYAFPSGHRKAGRWEGGVISRFEANQRDFQPGQTCRPHPAAKLVMRLQINDCVEMENDGERRLYRLQKINQNGQMSFAALHEANVDSRERSNEDPFSYLRVASNPLKKRNGKKVHISPTGQVSYERRRPPRRAA